MNNIFKAIGGCFIAFASLNASAEMPEKILGTTTIIKAVLNQKIVSDYVGPFSGFVTHDVYDLEREYILIPKGSKIHGKMVRISNVNEPISARIGFLIKSIIRPDSLVIDLSNDAALDHEGVTGIDDEVNHHLLTQFAGVVAYALISSGADGTQTGGLTGNVDVRAEAKNEVRQQYQPLASKYLQLAPTITINSGTTFNIFIEKPKKLKPFRSIFNEFIN